MTSGSDVTCGGCKVSIYFSKVVYVRGRHGFLWHKRRRSKLAHPKSFKLDDNIVVAPIEHFGRESDAGRILDK